MLIKRRDFIKIGSLATGSLLVPRFLHATNDVGQIIPTKNKVVVVLQLSGGNDGLNTVIPINNDIYYRLRPQLAIAANDVIKLTDEVGLNPHLPFFKELYEQGELAILNNVGYPEPNRSHFRSMDIWQSASQSNQVWQNGWIGRYLDHIEASRTNPIAAMEIDDTLSLALKGKQEKAIATKDVKRLLNNSHQAYFNELNKIYEKQHHAHHEKPVDYLYKTMASTLQSVDYLAEQQGRTKIQNRKYPASVLAHSLKTVASLILSDVRTQIYYVSIGSFDTHNNQQRRQADLFKQMDGALNAFIAELKQNGRFDDVLLFTFSEFGRRVAQNASNGTDHGTANQLFLISGGLKQKGLLNVLPDLEHLDNGDLRYEIDFKRVYATILNKWLQADAQTILGHAYEPLSFI